MQQKKIYAIINPISGGGRTNRKMGEIKKLLDYFFGQNLQIICTTKKHDATEYTRQIINDNPYRIIAVGGDGTVNEILNGYFNGIDKPDHGCALGIVNCGTGCGLAQSLNLPQTFSEQMEVIKEGMVEKIDCGEILLESGNDELVRKFFINELQIGIGSKIVEKTTYGYKKLGGLLAFGLVTLAAIIDHRNQEITIHAGDKLNTDSFVGLVVANGGYTGGGMMLTPEAKLNDGLFDFLQINAQTTSELIRAFPKIYSGSHIYDENFQYFQVNQIRLSSTEKVMIATDGELIGTLPCAIRVLPKSVRICTPN